MRRLPSIFSVALITLIFTSLALAQSTEPKQTTPAGNAVSKDKSEARAEAAFALKQRRAQVRALLVSLASDARNFRDQTLRARVQARVADALWDVDAEQARGLFRKAWEAAEVADKEAQQRVREDVRQQQAKSGGFAISSPPNLRGEVLRLAAKRDRVLGEEFLGKLKEEKQREAWESEKPDPMGSPESVRQRLTLAQQLLDSGDIERALQFAEPVLGTVGMSALNFLSFLREKDPAAADRRYATLLTNAEANPQSDANTVSLLASYAFTPHLFVTFDPNGGTNTSQMSRNTVPSSVDPELRAAFLRTAAGILMRPLLPPEQDQTTSGRQGKYLVVKRLLPLFTQYAPKEIAEVMRAQLDVLAAIVPEDARKRDDESMNQGIGPEQKSEDREQSLKDRIDHAKTADERDQLYLQLVMLVAQKGELRARDLVDKLEDSETRKQLRGFVDVTLALQAISKKDTERALEISRIGELTHLQRVWVLTQAAMLFAGTDRDKAQALLEQAGEEARRIDGSDADKPRALMAVASGLILIDRSHGWDATLDAVKAANSAEGFTGEDGRLVISLRSKGMTSMRTSSAEDFDVTRAFGSLANEDYERAVQLATSFQGDAPRASATIAIARAVLDTKNTPSKAQKPATKAN
ncbi:MAG TPA: hypothetical protein VN920_15875 [Pyrinomonadaceae bacterium]|nr:hypothetical protein [Pyrinomonadaceae bacterium]